MFFNIFHFYNSLDTDDLLNDAVKAARLHLPNMGLMLQFWNKQSLYDAPISSIPLVGGDLSLNKSEPDSYPILELNITLSKSSRCSSAVYVNRQRLFSYYVYATSMSM